LLTIKKKDREDNYGKTIKEAVQKGSLGGDAKKFNRYGRSFLLNQRLSPTQLAGDKGFDLWNAYMKTWLI